MGYRPLPLTGPQLERNHESVSDVRDAPRPARAPGGLTHRATMYSIQREHRLPWQRSVSRRGEACCKTSSVLLRCCNRAARLCGTARCRMRAFVLHPPWPQQATRHPAHATWRRAATRRAAKPAATWRQVAAAWRCADRSANLRSLAGAAARGARGRQPRSGSAAAERRSGGGERSVRSGW